MDFPGHIISGRSEKMRGEEEDGLIQKRTTERRYDQARRRGWAVLECLVAWIFANPRRFILGVLVAASAFAFLLFKLLYHPPAPPSPWRAQCRSEFPIHWALRQDFPLDSLERETRQKHSLKGSHKHHPSLSIRPLTSSDPAWPYPGQMPSLADADALAPVGVLVGVFSVARDARRRQLIRETYGSHPENKRRGREGVKVIFVMGRPEVEYADKVALEAELYGDLLLLDIKENMNEGKTHAFFAWAAQHAKIPNCHYPSHTSQSASATYQTLQDGMEERSTTGVVCTGTRAPDYVVKADDDSFIVLSELERRLRILPREKAYWGLLMYGDYLQFREPTEYMAGEGYGLSMDLVKFVATSSYALAHTIGDEDQRVGDWLRAHPKAEEIVWVSERCWMYDHPKAGKLLSHGFMFPDVVQSIREGTDDFLPPSLPPSSVDIWSTVTPYNRPYRPPIANLTIPQQIEALVEGSPMSMFHRHNRPYFFVANLARHHVSKALGDVRLGVKEAWRNRPTRAERMKGWEHGSTVLIHKVKEDEWWIETALALLGPREGR